jgi:hypothetical protein
VTRVKLWGETGLIHSVDEGRSFCPTNIGFVVKIKTNTRYTLRNSDFIVPRFDHTDVDRYPNAQSVDTLHLTGQRFWYNAIGNDQIDLDILSPSGQEIAEDKEESEGEVIAVNYDDDDGDGGSGGHGQTVIVSDKDDMDGVTGENDMVRLKIRKLSDGVTGVFRIVYDNEHIVIWKSLRKDASNDELVESDTSEFDVHQDTILWVEGIKAHGNTNGTIVALKLMDASGQPIQNAEDKVKIIVAGPVFAVFAIGPTTTGETTLRQYLNTAKKDLRTSPYIVNGQRQSGQPTYYSVNVWHSEKLTKIALSTEDAYVVIDGHSNFGLGPAFQLDLTSVSAFMNIGSQYEPIDWNYLRNDQGHPNLEIGAAEIPQSVSNYRVPGPDGFCKYDTDSLDCSDVLTLSGSGYNRRHYLDPSDAKRLVVQVGSADLPQLKFKAALLNGCYTYHYYYETFQHGVLFYTWNETSANGTTKEFVRGIIEGESWEAIKDALNWAEDEPWPYQYHQFN